MQKLNGSLIRLFLTAAVLMTATRLNDKYLQTGLFVRILDQYLVDSFDELQRALIEHLEGTCANVLLKA